MSYGKGTTNLILLPTPSAVRKKKRKGGGGCLLNSGWRKGKRKGDTVEATSRSTWTIQERGGRGGVKVQEGGTESRGGGRVSRLRVDQKRRGKRGGRNPKPSVSAVLCASPEREKHEEGEDDYQDVNGGRERTLGCVDILVSRRVEKGEKEKGGKEEIEDGRR